MCVLQDVFRVIVSTPPRPGRYGCGRRAGAGLHSLSGSEVCGADSVLSKTEPEKPRASPARAQKPSLRPELPGEEAREVWLLLRFSGQAQADGFHPKSGGHPHMPLLPVPQEASHVWAAALTVGLRADRDFGQQWVVGRKDFPARSSCSHKNAVQGACAVF